MERVLEMLAPDVVFCGDGGGIGRGLPQPIYGSARVSRLLAAFALEGTKLTARIEVAQITGQPGTLNFDAEGRLINVFSFEISGGGSHRSARSSIRTSSATSAIRCRRLRAARSSQRHRAR